MKIIGLTGGIASGKNFVADIFAKNGAAIFDADFEVHQIYNNNKNFISKIKKLFPQSVVDEKIDRKILGKIVFSDAKKLKILEKNIHPIIRKKYDQFLLKSRQEKRKIVVLNIPLLLEKQGYKCDKIISLLIPPSLQKRRFLSRNKNESQQDLEKKFTKIARFQMNNEERKKRSDFVIHAKFSKAHTKMQAEKILQRIA
ncbi:MAG: dephospho-CoA kinase [Rickettsiales bacterium]|nr:dephospho-CoA kinase [Rickettsiales bacterium]